MISIKSQNSFYFNSKRENKIKQKINDLLLKFDFMTLLWEKLLRSEEADEVVRPANSPTSSLSLHFNTIALSSVAMTTQFPSRINDFCV